MAQQPTPLYAGTSLGSSQGPSRGPRTTARLPDAAHPSQPLAEQQTFSSSATLNAQFWLEQFPWRPTAGWAVIAALFATGSNLLTLDWRMVMLGVLLADPLWGSIWRLAAGRDELLPLHNRVAPRPVWLPYLVPGSPAAQLLDWNHLRALPLLFRVGLPSLLLAVGVAAVLTPVAIWMTLCVLGISVVGWVTRRALNSSTTLLHSLVTITLPWLLMLTLFGAQIADADWALHLLLIAFWSLHNWGEGRNLRSSADGLGLLLLAVAEVGLMSLLISVRAPIGLALLIVLWLPTWLAIYYRQPLQRLNFLWLLAMLLSAWALGQSL